MTDGQEWPRHPNVHWRKVLAEARLRGWVFKAHSSHSFGTLSCPTGRCQIKIFTTGRGSESAARNARKKLDRCVHVPRAHHWSVEAAIHLDHAENLVKAANALIHESVLEEQFAELGATDDDIDAKLRDIVDAIEDHERTAQKILVTENVPADSSPSDVVGFGEKHARAARQAMTTAPREALVTKLRRRLKAVTSDLKQVRARIRH